MIEPAMATPSSHQPKFEKHSKLSHTLLFWFLLLALLPMTLITWISYQQTVDGLSNSVTQQLSQDAKRNARFINNWFDYRFMDLTIQADNRRNAELLIALKNDFSRSGKKLNDYTKSYRWTKLIDKPQQDLYTLYKGYDYIFDILLIDNQGNILFTVVKGADLGLNLFTGALSDSRLSHTVKETLQSGKTRFSDLEYYAPSERLAGFITAPMVDNLGEKIGVLAIQLQLERINKLLASQKNHTLHRYLVGEDLLLRTPLPDNDTAAVLVQQVNTKQVLLWKHEHSDANSHEKHPDNEIENTFQYNGPSGEIVIGIHQNISIAGINWAMISEIRAEEALATVNDFSNISLTLFILTAILVTLVALYQSHHITQPIIQLAKASMDVAAGERDKQVSIHVNNEIGRLAESFNHMLLMRQVHEQARIESNKTTQEALDNLAEQKFALDQHAIVAITDIKGRITFTNEKFCEISGYSAEELLGQDHRLLNSGYHDLAFFKTLYHTISAGKVWHGEICNRAKDGHLYWVDTTIVPFMQKSGKPKSYIAIRTDISVQQQGKLTLKHALDAAKSANSAKGEFLANMSHEIRTPMNGVIGMTNLLLDTPLNDKQLKQALTIKRSGEALLKIINDILDFSKIEAGKLDLELLDFSLDTMLEDLANTLTFHCDEKGLSLICPTNPKENYWYNADSGRIRQILTNLIGNAIKFTEQGEISLFYQSTAATQGKRQLLFRITDTGIGLSNQQQKRLFDRFTQADGSTTRKFGGTGLGLSISKQLVELMGGQIGVESKLGEGTTFWFTLYLEQVEPAETILQSPSNHTNTTTQFEARILVVDDNTTNQLVAQGMLEKFGAIVDIAGNGQEAIHALEQLPYDLVFMDCQMPVMDGYQASGVIRNPLSQVKNHQIPIIALTANAMQGDKTLCLAAGMDDYIAKPIDPIKLSSALQQWLPEQCQKSMEQATNATDGARAMEDTKIDQNKSGKPTETLPIFDYASMRARLMGDEALVKTIAEAFLNDLPTDFGKLQSAVEDEDLEQVAAMAHKIKGSSANIGGMYLSASAEIIEQAGRTGDVQIISLELAKLEQHIAQLDKSMRETIF